MKSLYCILCKKKHPHESWRHARWGTNEEEVEGWACGKHYNDLKKIKEYIPQNIKKARKKYAKSLLQPFRGNQLSKEFVKYQPVATQRMLDDGKITKNDIKSAKNVWSGDVDNYSNLDKTK